MDIDLDIEAAIALRSDQLRKMLSSREKEESNSNQDRKGGAAPTACTSSKNRKYEYLPHTSDVQLHSWGSSFLEALENVALALFSLMTDLDAISCEDINDHGLDKYLECSGYDAENLVFKWLDELLYLFHGENFITARIPRMNLIGPSNKNSTGMNNSIQNGNGASWILKSHLQGIAFDMTRHSQQDEVKAITYSNLQVTETKESETRRFDIYVIVDV